MKRSEPLGPLILGIGIGYAIGLEQNWTYAVIAFLIGSIVVFTQSFVSTFLSEWRKRTNDD